MGIPNPNLNPSPHPEATKFDRKINKTKKLIMKTDEKQKWKLIDTFLLGEEDSGAPLCRFECVPDEYRNLIGDSGRHPSNKKKGISLI
jgi:hypothetical protein